MRGERRSLTLDVTRTRTGRGRRPRLARARWNPGAWATEDEAAQQYVFHLAHMDPASGLPKEKRDKHVREAGAIAKDWPILPKRFGRLADAAHGKVDWRAHWKALGLDADDLPDEVSLDAPPPGPKLKVIEGEEKAAEPPVVRRRRAQVKVVEQAATNDDPDELALPPEEMAAEAEAEPAPPRVDVTVARPARRAPRAAPTGPAAPASRRKARSDAPVDAAARADLERRCMAQWEAERRIARGYPPPAGYPFVRLDECAPLSKMWSKRAGLPWTAKAHAKKVAQQKAGQRAPQKHIEATRGGLFVWIAEGGGSAVLYIYGRARVIGDKAKVAAALEAWVGARRRRQRLHIWTAEGTGRLKQVR